jgi:hypothetical protein
MAGSYRTVYQELWWRRIVKVVVCHLIYGMCGWIRGTRCAMFSYCKTDACKLNDDRTNNTESICKFTAGNAHYWTRDGDVSFLGFRGSCCWHNNRLGYYKVWNNKFSPIFRKNALPSYSGWLN